MERRDFIKTATAGGVAAATLASGATGRSDFRPGGNQPQGGNDPEARLGRSPRKIAGEPGDEVPLRWAPPANTAVAGRAGRLPPGQARRPQQRTRRRPDRPRRVGGGDHLLRQLLGLQRGRKRGPPGQARFASGGYRNRAFLMTKIDGRTASKAAMTQIERVPVNGCKTDHLDLLPVPRDHPHGRPQAGVRRRRRAGGGAAGARAGQAALHRLHRAQKPGDPQPHVRGGGRSTSSTSTRCRCR